MDYKRIIKSRNMRIAILRLLRFIPDRTMLKLQYRIKTGHKLNLTNPKRFTEKLQYYKLHYRNPQLIQCVDKYDVREYVESQGLKNILIPCYGVYESVDDICWENFPGSFVVKDTLGGGGASVILVKDKDQENIGKIRERCREWMAIDAHAKDAGREWPYYNGKRHRVIVEELLEADETEGGLVDYKFFCFHGEVEFFYVMGDRKVGSSVSVTIFDRNKKELPVKRVGDVLYENAKIPDNIDRMIDIAKRLSSDFPHVRVDLYNVKGQIFFGELTFYNASGYMQYDPDDFDITIGECFDIEKMKEKSSC